MKLGIQARPCGKSTLFQRSNKSRRRNRQLSFLHNRTECGIVPVPDDRLVYKLAELFKPERVTPATVEFVWTLQALKGASKGEGLGTGSCRISGRWMR